MKLGDTESGGPLRWVLRYDAYCECDQGCLPGEPRNPSSLLTLKYAKRIRTRCVNCRKVAQLNGITKGDGHAMSSPFSNSNPRLSNGRVPQSPQDPVVFDVECTKDKGESQFIAERIIAGEISRRRQAILKQNCRLKTTSLCKILQSYFYWSIIQETI